MNAKGKALKSKGSLANINAERRRQGYKPMKADRATKGLHAFLDKYD